MVDIDEAVVVRLETHGETFEVLADPDLALKYKTGEKKAPMRDVLAIDEIFKDARKGDKASEERMEDLFGSSVVKEVAPKVLKDGEFSLTTEQRRQIREDKRKQIVNYIARNAIDPQKNTPHPPRRIEKAMEEANIHIDINKGVKEQAEEVVSEIRPLIPIHFQDLQFAVKIKAKDHGKCYPLLKRIGEIKREEWEGENYFCVAEIPGGLRDKLRSSLNDATHGEVEIKLMKNEKSRGS